MCARSIFIRGLMCKAMKKTITLPKRTDPTTLSQLFLVLAAGVMITAFTGHAQITNTLLANPIFGASSGNTVASGWTYFNPPNDTRKDYWVVNQASAGDAEYVQPIVGTTNWWKQWNELYSAGVSNVAGIYQTFGCSPGALYQASGWLVTSPNDTFGADGYAWLQVEFLNSSSNVLALYKSDDFTASVGTSTSTNEWFFYEVTNACDLTQPVATGDPYFTTYAQTGAVSQLVAPVGAAFVRYRYCVLAAGSEGGSVYFSDAALDQISGAIPPVIRNLNPQNEIFVPPANGISFDVSSPSGFAINTSSIQLLLNGSNVSSGLVISGSSSNKSVSYYGIQSNSTYQVSITAQDSFNLSSSANTYFETTWVGVPAYSYLWLAVDWDFNSGVYYDDPDLCNADGGTNCYFGVVGVQGVDEFSTGTPPAQYYRGAADGIGTEPSGDYVRPDQVAAGRIDYRIDPFVGNPAYGSGAEWVNYTRDWPVGTNWIIGRFVNGSGFSGTEELIVLDPGVSTNVVGTFTMGGNQSWSTYEFVYLQDTNGQNATVVLTGKETLQTISGGNILPSFYMLVPAQVDLPVMSNLYPGGNNNLESPYGNPFEYTNNLSFTVTTAGATFPPQGIQVVLDGVNISSNLVITGSASSNNVVYPSLQPNATHFAIITITNSLGHGLRLTNQFDTFSQANYMFEAEDYDYNGGQYVPSAQYTPDCYTSYSSIEQIDYHHTFIAGEDSGGPGSEFAYRINGIPQEPSGDFYRTVFTDYFATDYQLYWFGGGDWANYTRDYPTGHFNLYARSSGLGAFTMDLGELISGAGTTNQVVEPIGQFSAIGAGISIDEWVPLTEVGGVAPVTVNIAAATTLQVSTPTGNCYPNFFMLVPASGVKLSAAPSGTDIDLSFPTQTGWNYRVFYRTNLTTGSWTLLNSVVGNGLAETVADSSVGGSQRFYEVTSP